MHRGNYLIANPTDDLEQTIFEKYCGLYSRVWPMPPEQARHHLVEVITGYDGGMCRAPLFEGEIWRCDIPYFLWDVLSAQAQWEEDIASRRAIANLRETFSFGELWDEEE
ncbi:MAG: hypothetical protein JSW08_03440 [archaeon]|nr:MAG: hypothetical protein JSW08_03440 [archaeon]